MGNIKKFLLPAASVLLIFHWINVEATEKQIFNARIESCGGCSLNRLPDVRKFIFEDVPKYENVEFKKIHGAVPELLLLNESGEEIERLSLSKLNREECNQLLMDKGFNLKPEFAKDNIKEEF